MDKLLKPNERIDDLQINNLKIIQNPKGFYFGIDAVLLANFASLKRNASVVDLGTGTGIIPILLAGKSTTSHIRGLEIQKDVADMARRSVLLNKLQDRIEIINMDLKQAMEVLPPNSFDVVISNPPYMHPNGLLNPLDTKSISRHEIKCRLEDVISVASRLLKDLGRFYMVHRPLRLVDIMVYGRQYKLEPKQIQFVHPSYEKKPNLLLLECRKTAKPELKVLDPLYVYKENGHYTDDIHRIYGRKFIENGEKIDE